MKCLHPLCNCQVEADQRYCSQECERSRDDRQERCACGHERCQGRG